MLVIDAQTGTILNAEHCFIVDEDKLNDQSKADLDSGNDSEVGSVARTYGVSLMEMGHNTGWGDNKYGYTVSYSPLSIKDEAEAYIEGGVITANEPEFEALMWVRNLPPAQLEDISLYIINDESVWDGFRELFLEAVMNAWEKRSK